MLEPRGLRCCHGVSGSMFLGAVFMKRVLEIVGYEMELNSYRLSGVTGQADFGFLWRQDKNLSSFGGE